jgi:carboxyl-terminal processing protease
MTFRVPGLLLAVLVASVPAPAQGNRTATPPTAPAAAAAAPAVASEAAAVRVRTFEQVWQTVNDKFFDPTFNGVDWNGVRARYAPRVAALTSDDALYPLLNTMLDELKVSHFAVIPPASMEEMSSSLEDDDSFGGDTGMTVRVVEGRPTVTAVDAGGPAAAAGLRPGFTLVRVGSHDLAEVLAKVKESGKRPVEQLYDARRLENNVGYVAFNIFLPQMMDQIRDAIRSFGDAPGVVVDLRNNPGGLGPMGTAVAALFLDKDTPLGTMQMRNGNLNFIAVAQPGPYTRPVAVLVDEGSASTSELLAAGLQECGRAAVVGGASLGAMLPSVIERLPNGAIFQYAVADFKTPKGVFLEGRGVVPDVPVTETRATYLAGGDPVLEAALSYIRRASSASPAPTPQAPR